MKLYFLIILTLPFYAQASETPVFIDDDYVNAAEFKCRNEQPEYTEEERKLVDILWDESVVYLEGYVTALSNSKNNKCINSDESIIETNTPQLTGPVRQCIMENRDMQLLVKHVYTIIKNKEKAFKCFSPQKNVAGLYSPSLELQEVSPVAKWLQRPSLKEYYMAHEDEEIKNSGVEFYKNFYRMVINEKIKMPKNFPYDVSAKNLPNLWASVGWVPMYSGDDSRSHHAGDASFRGGYAYGEVMGHWGLLQIESINGEPVGAEIGMTVQAMNTFYPYHFHNNQEIYYTLREPNCLNSIKQFVVSQKNKVLSVINEDNNSRTLEFDGARTLNVDHYWMSTTPSHDELLYIPRNSIHAFNLKENCEAQRSDGAHVTIWARSMSHEKKNDYGTTLLCNLKDSTLSKQKINSKDANVVCKQNRYVY